MIIEFRITDIDADDIIYGESELGTSVQFRAAYGMLEHLAEASNRIKTNHIGKWIEAEQDLDTGEVTSAHLISVK